MEELEKIRGFLTKLKAETGETLMHFEFFGDGSCGICDWKGNSYLEAKTVSGLLHKIENYQWDTNTNQNTNPAK